MFSRLRRKSSFSNFTAPLRYHIPRHRGASRGDIRPGLRVPSCRKRTVIAFHVDTERVSLMRLFSGGQDYETFLQEDSDNKTDD